MQMRQAAPVRRAAAGLAGVAAVAAGCASRGDDAALIQAARTTTTAAASTTTTVDAKTDLAERSLDAAKADAMALTLADLPAGWTANPGDGQLYTRSRPPAAGEFGACLHLTPEQLGPDVAGFKSGSFTNAAGDRILTNVTMMASADAGARQLAFFTSVTGPVCFAHAVKDAATPPKGGTFGEATGEAVPLGQIGDGAVQYRTTVPMTTADGRQFTLIEDAQMVLDGRAYIAVFYGTRSGKPFDAALARQLTQKVVDRAPAA